MSRTDFNPEYVAGFKTAKEFIDHYRSLHKHPETIGTGKDAKKHPLAGQVNMAAASNQVSDAEMVEVFNSMHVPDNSAVDLSAITATDDAVPATDKKKK